MSWTRGQVIGQGSTATVSVAKFNHSGDIFAVKSVELAQSEALQREGKVLSSLNNCPQIVRYKGHDVTCERNKLMYNVFMEYATGGTLSDVSRKQGGMLDEASIKLITRQVLQGLQYLHSKGIAHCDIKGKNILIDERGDAKIADFGCSKLINSLQGRGLQISGTPLYMAPEVAKGQEQGFESDIWALGCTIIEMASGCSPWPNFSDPLLVLYQIAFSDSLPEFPSVLSDEARDFLSKCLCRNKHQRWTASQLLEHPFLVDFVSHEKQIVESNFNSPTSILDQDVWTSLEVGRSPPSQVDIMQSNSWHSPASRIDMLVQVSEVPRWSSGEHWITTR